MKTKLKAILVGGPNDGQTWQLDEPKSEIEIAFRMMDRGEMKVTGKLKYKLVSNESPLRYEFENL